MSAEDVSRACLRTIEILDTSNFLKNSKDPCTSSDTNQKLENLECSVVTSRTDKSNEEDLNSSLCLTVCNVNLLPDLDSNNFELQNAIEDIAIVSEMNEFVLKEIEKFQKRNIPVLQDISPNVKYISEFCTTADKLKNIANHMKTLSCEGNQLKQVLTSDVLKDVWKINKDYHRSVINFFKLLSGLIKDFEVLVTSLENRKLLNPEIPKVIRAKEKKLLVLLEENMESLKKFDCYVKKYCLNRSC